MRRNIRIALSLLTSFTMILTISQNPDFQQQKPYVDSYPTAEISDRIRIFGLVNNPLNLSYQELLSFPMVSEVTTLECVAGDPRATYNWRGVPLFYLLTLAQVKPEAIKIVSRAPDDFESDLSIQDALKPTTILAVAANGTLLPDFWNSPTGLFRLVVPCKWGYKWVSNIKEIEVVDTDYKGTYESAGVPTWTDEADVPDCDRLPSIIPPLEAFDLVFGRRTFEIEIFTNTSITAFDFDHLRNEISLNITVPSGTIGFADLIIPQNLLKGPYSASLNNRTVNFIEVNVIEFPQTFILFVFSEGTYSVKITGTEFFGMVPSIEVDYNQTTYVDETVVFDASKSIDDGTIVSYDWSFGDGNSGDGATVSHSYTKEGTYQVTLNLTDNDGLGNFETLVIVVNARSILFESVSLILRIYLLGAGSILIFTFILLWSRRRPKK